MKKLSLIVLSLLCGGCVFLRYNYQAALSNIPPNARVLRVNNSYIEYRLIETVECDHLQYIYPIPQTFTNYTIQTNIYKAYYVSDTGKIYTTRKVIK